MTSKPPAATRIHLVRHGETVMNVQVRFRGLRDVPLNERGRQQATETARHLASAGVNAVYTSPLGRAREVADAILRASGIPKAISLDLLANLDYGEWEGLTREECAERDPEIYALYAHDPDSAFCPGGETLSSAADRIMAALREIGRQRPGESVAAVSHGVMLRLAVLRVLGARDGDWQFAIPMGSSLGFDVIGDQVTTVSDLDLTRPDPRKGALPTMQPAVRTRSGG
jgi:ribonuclease H / adenosylcobalamin/alpha-ribazole phosphatase